MQLSILTYNLLYHRAIEELLFLTKQLKPDIICLQETSTDEISRQSSLFDGYQLASTSNSFISKGKIYGLATFYNDKKLKIIRLEKNRIPNTLYDWWRYLISLLKRKNARRSVLKTTFQIYHSKVKITVFNVHLTAEATNEARIKQLKEVLNYSIRNKPPIILAGDFNYAPYRRKKMETIIKTFGFKEATAKIEYTFSPVKNTQYYSWFIRLLARFVKLFYPQYKLDYIFYKKLKLIETKRIPSKISDHYPILAIFEI
jgi:endonuclease/exonuclease/phosphatase family metal-dependent hydrolase